MFKKMSLGASSRNDLLHAAMMNGAMLSVADCWPLNREELAMILELTFSHSWRGGFSILNPGNRLFPY